MRLNVKNVVVDMQGMLLFSLSAYLYLSLTLSPYLSFSLSLKRKKRKNKNVVVIAGVHESSKAVKKNGVRIV